MDPIVFGRGVKALRLRKRWRQDDLAGAARVSRGVIARIEQGHAARVTVETLDKVAGALGGRVTCRLTWNGEGLDRLLDAEHAAIVEAVVRTLRSSDWLVATEVSFNNFGERGSIDVLAFHPDTRALLVVEVKSVVPDVQATLVTLDRKERLAKEIARKRGWDAGAVARLLVIGDNRTARRRSRHTPPRSATPSRIERSTSGDGSLRPKPADRCAACGFCQANLRRSLSSASDELARPASVAQAMVRDRRPPGDRETATRRLTTAW